MTGATAVGELGGAPASADGFAKRRVALVAGIAVVLFAVAFGVGSVVKSNPANQVSSPSLAATTPAAHSSPLAIVKVQAPAIPGLRRPVHKVAKTTPTTSGGQTAVTSTSPQLTSTTPVAPVQTLTTHPAQTQTTQAQTSTSGGGLNGGSS